MKTIGLFGGTGWSSTIEYYRQINQRVNASLGGYHSAKIILQSIDYHDIVTRYGKDPKEILPIFEKELQSFIALKPDCLIVCCNTLHKYFDMLSHQLNLKIPVFHAVHLTRDVALAKNYRKLLLLATKFTMEDGFFASALEKTGIGVIMPDADERNDMQRIHNDLMNDIVTDEAKAFFKALIQKYDDCDAAIVGCSEWSLVVDTAHTALPLIDTLELQCQKAVDFALQKEALSS